MFCWLCASLRAQSDNFAIDWFTIDSGGGTSADALYSVSGTAGQPDVGSLADDTFAISGGFWALFGSDASGTGLIVTTEGTNVVLRWPANTPGSWVEQTHALNSGQWFLVPRPIVVTNGQNTITIPASEALFYRLTTTTPPLPRLAISPAGRNALLSWPLAATGYKVEHSFDSVRPNTFAGLASPVVVSNGVNTMTITPSRRMSYFQLSPLRPVSLSTTVIGRNLVLGWPATATNLFLEANLDASQPDGWLPVGFPAVLSDAQFTVTIPTNANHFRLSTTPSPLLLKIVRTGKDVILSWPAIAAGYFLEKSANLLQPNGWSLVALAPVNSNGLSRVTLPASGVSYFRLNQNPPPPPLNVTTNAVNAIFTWVAPPNRFFLENTLDIGQPDSWLFVSLPVAHNNGVNTITIPIAQFEGFYRLTRTPHGPPVRIEKATPQNFVVSWPAPSTGYVLQRSLVTLEDWTDVTNAPVVVGGRNRVTFSSTTTNTFFRLQYR